MSKSVMRGLFWLAAMTACILLVLPGAMFPDIGFSRSDLIIHILMMAGVTALGVAGYARYRLPLMTGMATVALASEVIQLVVPYRYFDVADLAANMVGIGAGLIIGMLAAPLLLKPDPFNMNG